jgi:glutamate-1-semialdehyde aminotransferase
MEVTKAYFKHMLENNIIYLSPTTSHSWICSPHRAEDVETYLTVTEDFMKKYKD